jgi:tRNA U34 2-thiouridine synthase MnmA/TrmU
MYISVLHIEVLLQNYLLEYFLNQEILHNNTEFQISIRYRQPLQSGLLIKQEDGYYILFKELQRGITPGQFAAFYLNDELVASGVITH